MKRREFLFRTMALAAASSLTWAPGPLSASTAGVNVYKDPSCGCCDVWVDHLRSAGFVVEALDRSDMPNVKSRLGVPDSLQSCHTAVIGNYVIEGHVPVADVQRLLAEAPDALGLAVPGMPIGSPGMEMGDEREPYNVILFRSDGRQSIFARY